MVTLRHDVDLVVARLLVLRTNTGLFVANLVQLRRNLRDGVIVVHEVLHLQTALLDFGHYLWQTQIVRFAHQERDKLVQAVVVLLCTTIQFQSAGLLNGSEHLVVVVRTKWYALQPHHTAEIPLELFTSCIMSAWSEETITEKDILVVLHKIAGSIDGVHYLLDFLYVDVALLPCKDVIAREQLVGNVIERCIMMRHGIDLLVETRPALHIVQHLVHVATESYHHRQQLVFLHLA